MSQGQKLILICPQCGGTGRLGYWLPPEKRSPEFRAADTYPCGMCAGEGIVRRVRETRKGTMTAGCKWCLSSHRVSEAECKRTLLAQGVRFNAFRTRDDAQG